MLWNAPLCACSNHEVQAGPIREFSFKSKRSMDLHLFYLEEDCCNIGVFTKRCISFYCGCNGRRRQSANYYGPVVLASLAESDFVFVYKPGAEIRDASCNLPPFPLIILWRFKDEIFEACHISSCRSGIDLNFGHNRYSKFDGHRVLTRNPSAFRSK